MIDSHRSKRHATILISRDFCAAHQDLKGGGRHNNKETVRSAYTRLRKRTSNVQVRASNASGAILSRSPCYLPLSVQPTHPSDDGPKLPVVGGEVESEGMNQLKETRPCFPRLVLNDPVHSLVTLSLDQISSSSLFSLPLSRSISHYSSFLFIPFSHSASL
jgi:hypothetical protein